MSLVRAFASLRQQLLSHIQIPLNPAHLAAPAVGTWHGGLRRFADSTYLDKGQVTDRILNVIKNFDSIKNPEKISPDVSFSELGLDSLDVVELVMAIEEEFAIEIPDAEADKILTASEAISYISSHPMAK